MQNGSHAVFPNGIRALIVDSDARFLRSASLMLSLLNFKVASCETPLSAVKLLSGILKDADVVFIDALRATACGFDFRGLVESHLRIPVVYFFSFDYNVAGEVAEALKRTISAATYVIKKPLNASDVSVLWRVIHLAKVLLRSGENLWLEWPRGNRPALPSTVQAPAPLPGSSTVEDQGEDDDGREHLNAGRGRRRKLGDGYDGGSPSRGRGRGRGGVAVGVGGQPTRRQEQMNLIEGQESDDDDVVLVPSHQQLAQQNRQGLQAIGVQIQNQQQGRSLFMQPLPQMLNMPRYNPMIFADASGPSSSNVAAFAGASNISAAPALLPPLPVFQAPARAISPAPHSPVYSAQAPAPGLPPPPMYQQRQSVAFHEFGNMFAPPVAVPTMAATSGHQPQFTFNQQHQQEVEDMLAALRQGSWMGRRETEPTMLPFQQPPAADPFTPMAAAGGGTAFGISSPTATGAADSGEYGNVTAMAHLQPPNVGAHQPSDSFDFNDALRAAMVEMDFNAEALMAPTADELPAMKAILGNGNNAGIGPSMVPDANGGNSASFMAPQDPAVPAANQVELGAPDISGSLVGSQSQGSSAVFNGDGEMAAMFPSDQQDENTMFSLEALLDFDEGQQVGAADSANATYATGIMPNGGEESGGLGPNMGAADEGLAMLEEYLMDDNAADLLLPQDMNNGHQ